MHVHACPLVEALRTGIALRIDPEPDRALANGGERPESVVQQRLAEPLPPPVAAREESRDPRNAHPLRPADGARDDLAPCTDDRPKVGREVVSVNVCGAPLLERLAIVLPVVGEGGLVNGVKLLGVGKLEPRHGDAHGPERGSGLAGEIDSHLPEAANLLVAVIAQKRLGSLVGDQHSVLHTRHPARTEKLLKLGDEERAHTASELLRVHVGV
ncbi:MAG TPA: hypothetical protein VGU02_02155, partial [Gaiellaceae bacterium]|nr:hypothetical protein [Gaiellaceae bacterium]